ncbi:anaerobic sulfatase maturase [Clostridium intestinale]|uniref:anaerobic sulfatase maturase n=1 Tax=Clostridium intestinale TaxID=36845 RepID=UPI0028E29641|nr:anaerobic sulfatase maturase [Clostridium intestinale]
MPPINVLIKPASGSCNLKCKYCFYNDVAENREEKNYGLMNYDTLEVLVKKVFEYGEYSVGFAFQGGEPTLIGIDFYKHLIELQKKYNVKKLKINNAIQTNGMKIDDEWAKFLSENNFLVGLSLDGPKEVHDLNRIDINGIGSYKRIEKTIESFNKYGVEYNILCVVTKSVARHIQKIYTYYKKKGFNYLQFIPCLDELGEEAGNNPYSLTPEVYAQFLKTLFDLWYRDFMEGKRISIRMFDNILQIMLGYRPESCDMSGTCSANLVVEANGACYPCDFYVLDKWKMGSIVEDDIKDLLQGETAREFIEVSLKKDSCNGCQFISICKGGCRRHYEPIGEEGLGKNYFCSSYKDFYNYTVSKFQEVARIVSRY